MLYSASGSPIASAPDTTRGAIVELLSIQDAGDCYEIMAAVDGRKLPSSFYESRANVQDMDEETLMAHLREQAIGLADYYQSQEAS